MRDHAVIEPPEGERLARIQKPDDLGANGPHRLEQRRPQQNIVAAIDDVVRPETAGGQERRQPVIPQAFAEPPAGRRLGQQDLISHLGQFQAAPEMMSGVHAARSRDARPGPCRSCSHTESAAWRSLERCAARRHRPPWKPEDQPACPRPCGAVRPDRPLPNVLPLPQTPVLNR